MPARRSPPASAHHRWFRLRLPLAGVVAASLLTGCSDGDAGPATLVPTAATPVVSATYTGPGELVTIVATTQLHLDGVAIGVGNIWDEDYTPTPGEVRHGLTGMVFVSVAADNSKNFALRVHPGQELDIPGYHLQVLAVDERSISLAIEDRPQ